MSRKIRVKVEAIRSLAFGSIAAGYTAVGTALANPSKLIIFDNLTDANIIISLDGVTDHFIVPAQGFKLIDLASNKTDESGFFIAEGTIFYAKREAGAPSSGNLYIQTIHE